MRRIYAAILFLGAVLGCHAQQGAKPSYTCPAIAPGVYTPLNPVGSATNPPVTVMTYLDTTAAGGTWCAIVETNQGGGISQPSNIAGPTTIPATGFNLQTTWTMPTGANLTGASWTVSRAQAIAVYPTAPTNAAATAK